MAEHERTSARNTRARADAPLALAGVLLLVALGVISFALLWPVGNGEGSNGATAAAPVSTAPAQAAPDFTVQTAQGDSFTLSRRHGSGVILAFTSSWCISCGPKLQAVARLYPDYRERGLGILVLNPDPTDPPEAFTAYLQRWGAAGLPWAMDEEARVTLAYQITSLGTIVGIDRAGSQVYKSGAAMQDALAPMRSLIERVLQ
jgi:peroxiredoxin